MRSHGRSTSQSLLMQTEPTLKDRAKDWIRRNVPRHSQAQYEELLETNERLALRLLSLALDYEALLEAHDELQRELWESTPTPSFTAAAELDYHPARFEKVLSVRWQIEPMRQNVAIIGEDVLNRYSLPRAKQELKRFFLEAVAPRLWDQAEASIARAVSRAD